MVRGILDELCHDHEEVRKMLRRLDETRGTQRRDLFESLVAELVRHEVAEEEILRPVSKRDAGEAIANARMKEESEAESLLKEMEKLDPDSPEFEAKLKKLQREVEAHAEAEETKEFPRIAAKEPKERLQQMAKIYDVAKSLAPTRPHPSTPNTPVANLLIGPFAAVIDRARDAFRDARRKVS